MALKVSADGDTLSTGGCGFGVGVAGTDVAGVGVAGTAVPGAGVAGVADVAVPVLCAGVDDVEVCEEVAVGCTAPGKSVADGNAADCAVGDDCAVLAVAVSMGEELDVRVWCCWATLTPIKAITPFTANASATSIANTTRVMRM